MLGSNNKFSGITKNGESLEELRAMIGGRVPDKVTKTEYVVCYSPFNPHAYSMDLISYSPDLPHS